MVQTAKRGAIVSTSSASALVGLAYNSVYAGSKGYNRAFSLSLGAELADQIDTLALTPFFFYSGIVGKDDFKDTVVGTFFVESSDAVARAALRALGRRREAIGTLRHEVLV